MNKGHFRIRSEIEPHPIPFGTLRWICQPAATGARQLTVLEGEIRPGEGHAFHMHPNQEEMIYILSGTIEQWIGKEKRMLGAGDAVFCPPGVVHASFNAGKDAARLLAIFGPCIGDGFETTDVAAESPWKDLRG